MPLRAALPLSAAIFFDLKNCPLWAATFVYIFSSFSGKLQKNIAIQSNGSFLKMYIYISYVGTSGGELMMIKKRRISHTHVANPCLMEIIFSRIQDVCQHTAGQHTSDDDHFLEGQTVTHGSRQSMFAKRTRNLLMFANRDRDY